MSTRSESLSRVRRARKFFLCSALWLLAGLPVLAEQSATLTWNPSPNSDVAGYKIYFGGVSRVYTNTVILGNVTNVTISGLCEGTTYYFAATTVDSAGVESDFSNEATYAIPTPEGGVPIEALNQPPTLNSLANLTIFQNAGLQTVALAGISSGASNEIQNLTVSAISSDLTLIPNPTVNYSSPNSSGTLTFAPVAGAMGTATVTVTVDDGSASNNITTQVFSVTVIPAPVVNVPPTLDPIPNITLFQNAGVQNVALTGISSGSINEIQTLAVSAGASKPGIITAPAVNYTSPNSAGTLTFSPVTNALGTTMVTVAVNDGGTNNSIFTQMFSVTVVPNPAVNQPPTMDPIADVTLIQNGAAQTITLTGISSGSPTENQVLQFSATSSNPRLVQIQKVSYTSPASLAALTIKPVANGAGKAVITVTVNDGGSSNNVVHRTFNVTVQANRPPTLNPIANVVVSQNAAAQTITVTGIGSGSPSENQTLRVSATSSNPRLVPAPVIQYTSPGTTAQLVFKPAGSSSGKVTITVAVNDGSKLNNLAIQRFTVTVVPASNTPATTGPGSTNNLAAVLAAPVSAQGQFSFQVNGIAGGKYVVEATSDFVHWTSVKTNTAPFTYRETAANEFEHRYYRTVFLR